MDVKSLLKSKTIWGIVVSMLALVAKKSGLTIDEGGLVNDIVIFIGYGFAFYGRLKAEKKIGGIL